MFSYKTQDIKIAPSLLSADLLHLNKEIKDVEKAGANFLHIDIMDGHFVPNISFGPSFVSQVRKVTKLPLDVHLMVLNADFWIEKFVKAGADILTIHKEGVPDPYLTLKTIKNYGIKSGIAINPKTDIEYIIPFVDYADVVVIMCVEPGFGGQDFIRESLDKIKILREKFPHKELEVDGGIDANTVGAVIKAGANILVTGNHLFDKSITISYKDRIQRLKRIPIMK
ncbi:MAG: ribulose-phosphate 3-epimerase [Alphaproteobacteria bacterium]